jgi:hypothetical protein
VGGPESMASDSEPKKLFWVAPLKGPPILPKMHIIAVGNVKFVNILPYPLKIIIIIIINTPRKNEMKNKKLKRLENDMKVKLKTVKKGLI